MTVTILTTNLTTQEIRLRYGDRITNRIHTYLLGNFSLPRGWTLLTILLYALLFILLLYLRTTIMVSGQ